MVIFARSYFSRFWAKHENKHPQKLEFSRDIKENLYYRENYILRMFEMTKSRKLTPGEKNYVYSIYISLKFGYGIHLPYHDRTSNHNINGNGRTLKHDDRRKKKQLNFTVSTSSITIAIIEKDRN